MVFGILLLGLSFVRKRNDLLALSLLAVISNVMFYHRDYDYVSLIFPLAYVLVGTERKTRTFTFFKWLVCVVVAWTFYGSRILLRRASIPIIGADFVLLHALLCELLVCFTVYPKVDEG